MTKKLEELLNIESDEDQIEEEFVEEAVKPSNPINLQDQLEDFDKISAALPKVKGLGDMSDAELDALARKAEKAYNDLMDLGMNVESRYSTRIFEVAGNMLNAAITAKSNKINNKLKMVELQLKKLAIDKKHSTKEDEVEGEGYILTDRNSILEKLKNLNK